MSTEAPAHVLALAEARAEARARRDWDEADRLRAGIEAAGWKVVDEGLAFALAPAHAPDVVVGGRLRYGSSASVPSRLEAPPVGLASVVVVGVGDAADLSRTVAGVREHAPAATQLIVVGDAPTLEVAELLGSSAAEPIAPGASSVAPDGSGAGLVAGDDRGSRGPAPEVVMTGERLGRAGATNAGVRRAVAPVVILLDGSVEVVGDFVTPLVSALDDPTVALVGASGSVSRDLRRFEDAPAGDVDIIAPSCLAFRRSEYLERGPLDERLRTDRYVAAWWSLALRDVDGVQPPRRAVALDGLPLVHRRRDDDRAVPADGGGRGANRDFYRVLDRFGPRRDVLLGGGSGPAAASGVGDARPPGPGR